MASWGLELELHGIFVTLRIQRASVKLQHNQKWTEIPILPTFENEFTIGPSREQETDGLYSLAIRAASAISERTGIGRIDLPERNNLNYKLYKEFVQFINPTNFPINLPVAPSNPLIPSLGFFEEDMRTDSAIKYSNLCELIHDTVFFSFDHYKNYVIPELIMKPFGRYQDRPQYIQGHRSVARNRELNYLRYLFYFADTLNRTEFSNLQFFMHNLTLSAIINQTLVSKGLFCRIECEGTISASQHPRVSSGRLPLIQGQLNTIIDLTHFAPQIMPNPNVPTTFMLRSRSIIQDVQNALPNLFRISHLHVEPNISELLGHFTSRFRHDEYEIYLIDITRRMVAQAIVIHKSSIDPQFDISDTSNMWIEGAIGLGIWSVLELCLGSHKTPAKIFSAKDLWCVLPKTQLSIVLMAAYKANPTYYASVVSILKSRIMPNIFPKQTSGSIPSLRHGATKILFPPVNDPRFCKRLKERLVRRMQRVDFTEDQIDLGTPNDWENFVCNIIGFLLSEPVVNFCPPEWEIYVKYIGWVSSKIPIDSPSSGYGRPKFEVRRLLLSTEIPPIQYLIAIISVVHNLAKPIVPIPAQIDDDAVTVDASIAFDKFDESTDVTDHVWFPKRNPLGRGLPHVKEWLRNVELPAASLPVSTGAQIILSRPEAISVKLILNQLKQDFESFEIRGNKLIERYISTDSDRIEFINIVKKYLLINLLKISVPAYFKCDEIIKILNTDAISSTEIVRRFEDLNRNFFINFNSIFEQFLRLYFRKLNIHKSAIKIGEPIAIKFVKEIHAALHAATAKIFNLENALNTLLTSSQSAFGAGSSTKSTEQKIITFSKLHSFEQMLRIAGFRRHAGDTDGFPPSRE